MTKNQTIAVLCSVAGIAALILLLWQHSEGDPRSPVLQSQKETALSNGKPDPWKTLARQFARSHGTEDPVSIDFHQTPLPEVLDQLVHRAGIKVTADFEESQDHVLVTMEAFVPPLDALKTVSEMHGLELLEMDSGWWLRPTPAVIQVIYQPSLIAMDEGRTGRLLQTLREITGSESSGTGNAVAIDRDGIHVTASKKKQEYVASYLSTLFKEPVNSKNPESRAKIPAIENP